MRHIIVVLVAFSAGSVSFASSSSAVPIQITVPALVQFCVSSNPVPGSAYVVPELREGILDGLSQRLEQSALEARVLTIGVPFVDDVTRTPSLTASASNDDEGHATYVIRQCAVIPAAKAPAFPLAGVVQIPAHMVVAVLCEAANLDMCRHDVEAVLRTNSGLINGVREVTVRTRQALSTNGSAAGLIAALSDSSLILLREESDNTKSANVQTVPADQIPKAAPNNLAVISAEFN